MYENVSLTETINTENKTNVKTHVKNNA